MGNIKDLTLEQMWNGEKIRALRREFLLGKPKQCSKLIQCKGCHRDNDDILADTVFTEYQERPPIALDLILNGKCNIDCIMCEVKKQEISVPKMPEYDREIVDKIYPSVKRISVKSGEPFVQKETYDIIEKVSNVNQDCVWYFTTNGQYNFNQTIVSALNKIKIGKIAFSVDSVDEAIFAEIRKPGSLTKCLATIQKMREWAKTKEQEFDIAFSINATIQKKNWKNIPELMAHFRNEKLPVDLLFVSAPHEHSLLDLAEQEVENIFEYIVNLPDRYLGHLKKIFQALTPLRDKFVSAKIKKYALLIQIRINEHESFLRSRCPLPFAQLAQTPDGKIKPCCWLGDFHLTTSEHENYLSAWEGEALRGLRKKQLNGELSVCTPKMAEIGCHKHDVLSTIVDFDVNQPRTPLRLDWFFSGKCNLECPSCNHWMLKDEFQNSDKKFEDLKQNVLPYVCEIDLKGGEPFFQRRTYELINFMRKTNPLCVWDITTNGQIAFSKQIQQYIDQLLIGTFSVSIDSLDPSTFAKLRKGGTLDKAMEFLNELISYNNSRVLGQKFDIYINFVLQKSNWMETDKIIEFCNTKGIGYYIIPLVEPVKLSIYDLSNDELNEIAAYISKLNCQHSSASKASLESITKTIKKRLTV